MVKSKILTPILAGVLGVSVAGSAVGYVLVNKDSDKKDSKKNEVVSPVDKIKDGGIVPGFTGADVSETIDTAEKAIKGELDFAYDANATLSFGDSFKQMAGVDIGSIGVKTSTKQKNNKTQADFSLLYNDNNLASANVVYDRDSGLAYLQIPELSESYLSVDINELMSQIEDQFTMSTGGTTIEELMGQLEGLEFDTDAMSENLGKYIDAALGAMPEGKEGEEVSGDIEGYDYTFTTKTYTITGKDFANMLKAVLEEAKNDENLKSLYEQIGAYATGTATGTVSNMSYEELIDQVLASMGEVEDGGESVSFDVYYNQDIPAGLHFDMDGAELDIKSVLTGAVTAVDMKMSADGQDVMTFKGAVEEEDGEANGQFAMNFTDGLVKYDMIYKLTNVSENGGTVRLDINYDDGSEAFSAWAEMISNTSDSDMSMSATVGFNGDVMFTLTFEGKKTEASDVELPTGQTYDVTDEAQLQQYLESVNTEGFLANLKQVLGDEIYNAIIGSASGYETYDYDDDDDDYDYDQFDLDDYDLGDLEDLDIDELQEMLKDNEVTGSVSKTA